MDGENLVAGLSVIASGIMIAGAAIGSGMGVGQVGAKFIEGSARNPMESGRLQAKAFIMAGALDAIPMIAVAMSMMLLFANPLI